jgi:hypothetical protein
VSGLLLVSACAGPENAGGSYSAVQTDIICDPLSCLGLYRHGLSAQLNNPYRDGLGWGCEETM